jgi:hypothetical protein
MASSDKKTKADPAPAKEPASKDKSTTNADAAKAEPAKPEAAAGKPDAAPKSYSRGEGQKPVTQAYKDNWNAIFAKKPNKKKR